MTDHRSGNGAMIPLARLWLKTSERTGKTYLTGRLGAARILVFENRDRASDDDPTHMMFIAPGPDQAPQGQRETRPQARASESHGAAGHTAAPSAPRQAGARPRPASARHAGKHVRPFDDDLSVLA